MLTPRFLRLLGIVFYAFAAAMLAGGILDRSGIALLVALVLLGIGGYAHYLARRER